MAIDLYACTIADFESNVGKSANSFVVGDKLPSPVSLKRSDELVWSQDTGRTAGSNAKMIGDLTARKKTYTIQWGIISNSDMSDIRDKLRDPNNLKNGFFKFGYGQSISNASSNAISCYRSEIQADIFCVGNTTYYNNVTVQIIEQ